ncbi:phospho-sugar mutase [Microlunatus flavus]|uniref:Phosphomannomutase n=1 Tax=Microlunatus flavus TaxID=1036181 RepID=A0A1H9C1H9_9ACTN|nr:phospho-sugar mutase [Microlunatus flavus]SEP94984.1 phosphomannomutase [Microlunatus flavus]
MAVTPELRGTVEAWVAQDPDPATRAEAQRLLEAADAGDEQAHAGLVDAFTGRLAFGTAGLRGALGPGPNRMNRVVVTQAAAGLAAYLRDQVALRQAHGSTVLVGHDARHGSERFALDTVKVLAAAGFDAVLTDGPVPTPVVAFGILHLGCEAGVVVTASHNPARDNGYKVYLGDGSQIVPPADAEIAARIDEVARRPLDHVQRSDAWRHAGPHLLDAYAARAASLAPAGGPRDLRWAYTPMHGVGGGLVLDLVARAGFPAPAVVAEQAEPDPDFPTVAFPNPEEPGAIDRALALGEEVDADVVVANDPDADRCAVAARFPDGGWRMLTGDELGVLLGEDALRRGVRGTYACSVVSSTELARVAAAHGQPFAATLTGFKWIGRVPGLAFGYEEAIGYCVDPEAVHDKDGMTALVRVLALVAQLKADGSTVAERLDEIATTYGVTLTGQLSARVDDLSQIGDAMARLRARPPASLVGEPVEVSDLGPGIEGLPPTDAVRLEGPTVRVVVRPSGTEPKLKAYLEARVPLEQAAGLADDRRRAGETLARLRQEMTEALGLG